MSGFQTVLLVLMVLFIAIGVGAFVASRQLLVTREQIARLRAGLGTRRVVQSGQHAERLSSFVRGSAQTDLENVGSVSDRGQPDLGNARLGEGVADGDAAREARDLMPSGSEDELDRTRSAAPVIKIEHLESSDGRKAVEVLSGDRVVVFVEPGPLVDFGFGSGPTIYTRTSCSKVSQFARVGRPIEAGQQVQEGSHGIVQ